MSLFVMLYVWQNIEIVRIELECRSLARVEKRLREENNRLRGAIETLSSREVMKSAVVERGYVELSPGQVDSIRFEDTKR